MNNKGRRLQLIILALACSQLVLATPAASRSGNAAANPQSKEFRQTVEVEDGANFQFDTDKGSVRLTSWESNKVEIYARIEPPKNESEDYGRRAVEAARIEVLGGGRSLTVRSNFEDVPNQNRWAGGLSYSKSLPNIHYEIRAPRHLNLSIELDRSKLELQGFRGNVTVEADRSPVTASDLDGDLRFEIDRGTAKLSNLQGSIALELDRTDGVIHISRLTGDSRLITDRGEVEVRLPPSQGLSLRTEFSKRTIFDSDIAIATRSPHKTHFEGTINGGGPQLRLEADRGSIRLKQD